MDIAIKVKSRRSSYVYDVYINGEKFYNFWIKMDIGVDLPVDPSWVSSLIFLVTMVAAVREKEVRIVFTGDIKRPTDLAVDIVKEIMVERRICYREFFSTHPELNDIPRLAHEDIHIAFLMTEENAVQIVPDEAVINSFSFGKESQLNRKICEDILPVEFRGSYFVDYMTYTAPVYRNEAHKYPNLHMMTSNMNHLQKKLSEYLGLSDRQRWYTGFPFSFLPLMYATKSRYFSMGNELDCTRLEMSTNGEPFYHWELFDESIYFQGLYKIFINEFVKDGEMFSPYVPVFETSILKILADQYPEAYNNIIACWFPRENKLWCSKCEKCNRYAAMIRNLDLPHYEGLDMSLERDKENRLSFMSPEESYEANFSLYLSKFEYIPEALRESLLRFYMNAGMDVDNKDRYKLYGQFKPEAL